MGEPWVRMSDQKWGIRPRRRAERIYPTFNNYNKIFTTSSSGDSSIINPLVVGLDHGEMLKKPRLKACRNVDDVHVLTRDSQMDDDAPWPWRTLVLLNRTEQGDGWKYDAYLAEVLWGAVVVERIGTATSGGVNTSDSRSPGELQIRLNPNPNPNPYPNPKKIYYLRKQPRNE